MGSMRREIEKDAILNPTSCDLPEFGSLLRAVVAAFGASLPVPSIKVSLPGEVLEFDDIDDLLESADRLPSRITNISVGFIDHALDDSRSCWIRVWFGYLRVSASGTDPVWCAGVVDLARDFAQRHSRWYSYAIRRILRILSYFLIGFVVVGAGKIAWRNLDAPTIALALAVLAAIAAVLGAYIFDDRLFPSVSISVRQEPSFLKRYQTEITVIAAAVSAVAAFLAILLR